MSCHVEQAFSVQEETGIHVKTSKIPAISPPFDLQHDRTTENEGWRLG